MKKFISCILTAAIMVSMLSLAIISVSAVNYWNNDIKFTAAYGTVNVGGSINLNEWNDTQAIEVRLNNDPLEKYINYQGGWGDGRVDSDYQGTYKIKWDENYIYFLEIRVDDHVNLFGDSSQPWMTDGALIFTQAPDVPATVNPEGVSHHVFYTVGNDGKIGGDVMVRICNMEFGSREIVPIDGAKITSELTSTGYMVEIAVPWSMYTSDIPNFKGPKAGDIMGLSYVVHDSDTDEVAHVKQFCYAVDNDMLPDVPGGYDFGGWGIVELLAPVAVAEPEPVAVVQEEGIGGGDVNLHPVPAPAPVVAAVPIPTVPQTSDYAVILLIVLAIVSAGIVAGFVKKSKI